MKVSFRLFCSLRRAAGVICVAFGVMSDATIAVAAAEPITPITPVPPGADLRVAAVKVRVVLGHRDWTYRVGEVPRFRIHVTADEQPIDDVTVSYAVAPDMLPGEEKSAALPLEGLVVEGGTMKEPGFLRCVAKAQIAGKTYRGVATAAFEPEKIKPFTKEPADFDAFWQRQIRELGTVPVEPMLTLLPEACTDTVNVYHVSFRTLGTSRMYGILCEPKKPGRYPAVLKVPGAGVRAYHGDKKLAAEGVITLEIGIHGIPVNLAENVYSSLAAGPLAGYWGFNADNPELYYYRRVYLGCVRANDFIATRELWDGKNLIVTGASQGGQLTIVTAALDKRVTGLAATHPAGCDFEAELHGRAGGWPHPFAPDYKTGKPSGNATQAKIEALRYYDVVNFAKRLTVPGYYTWGYNDDVTPPTSVYAAYNVIRAPKRLGLTLEMAHSYNQEQGEATIAWIREALRL